MKNFEFKYVKVFWLLPGSYNAWSRFECTVHKVPWLSQLASRFQLNENIGQALDIASRFLVEPWCLEDKRFRLVDLRNVDMGYGLRDFDILLLELKCLIPAWENVGSLYSGGEHCIATFSSPNACATIFLTILRFNQSCSVFLVILRFRT